MPSAPELQGSDGILIQAIYTLQTCSVTITIITIMQNHNFINFILHCVILQSCGVLQYCVLWYIV